MRKLQQKICAITIPCYSQHGSKVESDIMPQTGGRTEMGLPFWPNTTFTCWWLRSISLTSLVCLYLLHMG